MLYQTFYVYIYTYKHIVTVIFNEFDVSCITKLLNILVRAMLFSQNNVAKSLTKIMESVG